MRRLHEKTSEPARPEKIYSSTDDGAQELVDFAQSLGWDMTDWQARRLIAGGEIIRGDRRYYTYGDGRIASSKVEAGSRDDSYTRIDRRLARGIDIAVTKPEKVSSQKMAEELQANSLISRMKAAFSRRV